MEKKDNLKSNNFKRLAEARTNKILDMMDLLGNLSNTSFYEFESDEVEAIFDALQESLNKNKSKFSKKKKQNKRRFTL